jgi:hypothetical protein
MKLPKLTKKQTEILLLLYTYRFLNRIQIQTLMNHKDKKTINMWLKDLTEKNYIKRIYSDHFLEKTKPAIYYLGINGIRQLKTLERETTDASGTVSYRPAYPIEELRKRYREHERSQGFIDRSILVAQCCIDLKIKAMASNTLEYYRYTQADYVDEECAFHFLSEHETIRPSLCIVKQEQSKQSRQNTQDDQTEEAAPKTNYLLEIFDSTLPRYRVKKRIKDYVQYLIDDDWDSGDNDPPPIILLVMPTLIDLIYAKRRTKKLLLDEYYEAEDIPEDLHIRFTTIEQLKQNGITANIWEERRKLYDV